MNEKETLGYETAYKSKVTGKWYPTLEQLQADEVKIAAEQKRKEALKNERAERAKGVEAAYKAFLDAQREYIKLRNKFVEDYGSYHMSYIDKDDNFSIIDVVKEIFSL